MLLYVILFTSFTLFNVEAWRKSDDNDAKIIGGEKVDITDFPYQVLLLYNGQPICGGAIVDANTILTATHCIFAPGSYTIRAGSANSHSGGVMVPVHQAIKHPGYDKVMHDSDVCILKLERPLNFTDSVQAVDLPEKGQMAPPGTLGYVSGWGLVKKFDRKSKAVYLRAAKVPVIDIQICRSDYRLVFRTITSRMFCAGYRNGGHDSCQGDSGGPFVINGTLYGLVSWGLGCANGDFPGVYTNVAELIGYIQKNGNLDVKRSTRKKLSVN